MASQDPNQVKYVLNTHSTETTAAASACTNVQTINSEDGPVTVIFMDNMHDSSSGEINLNNADVLNNILNTPGVEVSIMDADTFQSSNLNNQNVNIQTIVTESDSGHVTTIGQGHQYYATAQGSAGKGKKGKKAGGKKSMPGPRIQESDLPSSQEAQNILNEFIGAESLRLENEKMMMDHILGEQAADDIVEEETVDGGYPCTVCGLVFKTKVSRGNHSRVHTRSKRNHCLLCGAPFKTELELLQHLPICSTPEEQARVQILTENQAGKTLQNHIDLLNAEAAKLKELKKKQEQQAQSSVPNRQLYIPRVVNRKSRSPSKKGNKGGKKKKGQVFPEISEYELDNYEDNYEESSLATIAIESLGQLGHGESPAKKKQKYKCTLCNDSFSTLVLLLKHRANVHAAVDVKQKVKTKKSRKKKKDPPGTEYPCQVCGKVFLSSTSLGSHSKVHFNERIHTCLLCGFDFNSELELLEHLPSCGSPEEYHRLKNIETTKLEKRKSSSNIDPDLAMIELPPVDWNAEKEYPCTICGKVFKSKGSRGRHSRIHFMKKKKNNCLICGSKFQSESELLEHVSSCGTKEEQDRVKDIYQEIDTIKNEAGDISSDKPVEFDKILKDYPCKNCDKTFFTQAGLTNHNSRIHGIVKCCDKPDHPTGIKVLLRKNLSDKQAGWYTFRSNAFWHVNHTVAEASILKDPDESLQNMGPDEKIYKCVYCHQCFRDMSEATEHVIVHRTVCSECGIKVADLPRLRRHRLNVHKCERDGKYKCLHCPSKFGNKPDMMAHMKLHVGPWMCERRGCDETFTERKDLVLHRKDHGHPDPDTGMAVFDKDADSESLKDLTSQNISDFINEKSSFTQTIFGKVWAPVQCKICREQFTNSSIARKHITAVHVNGLSPKKIIPVRFVMKKQKKVHNKRKKYDNNRKTSQNEEENYKEETNKRNETTATKTYTATVKGSNDTEDVPRASEDNVGADSDQTGLTDTVEDEDAQMGTEDGNNVELDDTKTRESDQSQETKTNISSSSSKSQEGKRDSGSDLKMAQTIDNSYEILNQALGIEMDLDNVTYIDSHGQSVQDLVNEEKMTTQNIATTAQNTNKMKHGYRIAPQTIVVPNSDVTLELMADGTIITKDKQGTNFSEINLESLGIDLNSLEGQTNIELVIVQSDGTEVKATIQAQIEKNPDDGKVKETTVNLVPTGDENQTDGQTQEGTGEERLYKCSKCPRTFKYYNTYQCHESVHDRDVTYTCPLCFRVFAKSKNLTTHLELHKAKLGEKKYLSALKETKESKIAAKEISKSKEFHCTECDKVFTENGNLKRHLKQVHERKDVLHKCPHCPKSFSSKKNFDEHVKSHIGPFECNHCGESFSCDTDVISHLKDKHQLKNPYARSKVCPICKIAQGSKDKYAKHLRHDHVGSIEAKALLDDLKIHKCDLCSAKFEKLSKLKQHILSHTRDQKYACQFCTEKFALKSRLFDHYREHHNEKLKNPCKICMKNFLTKAHLTEHNKRHHSQAYRCTTCERMFTDYDLYCQHVFDEHGDGLACDVCKEVFMSRKSLLKHKSVKHASKHPCQVCGEEFDKSSDLRKHEVEDHAEETVWDIENDTVISDPTTNLKCDLCSFEVSDDFLYRQHYLTKHFKGDEEAMENEYPNLTAKKDSGQTLIICDHCGNDFPGMVALNKHLTELGLETLTYIDDKEKDATPKKKTEKSKKKKVNTPKKKGQEIDEDFTEMGMDYDDYDEDCTPNKVKKSAEKKKKVKTPKKKKVQESDEDFTDAGMDDFTEVGLDNYDDDEDYVPNNVQKSSEKKKKSAKKSKKQSAVTEDKESFLGSNFKLNKTAESGGSPLKPHKCYVCGERFSSEVILMEHATTHDDESDVDEQIIKANNIKPLKFKCEKCGNTYATSMGLTMHYKHKHSDLPFRKKARENIGDVNEKQSLGFSKKKLSMTTVKDKNLMKQFAAVYTSPTAANTKTKPVIDSTKVNVEEMSPFRVSTSGRMIKKSQKTRDQMQCEICFKQFMLEASLLKHMIKKHQINTSPDGKKDENNVNAKETDEVSGTFCKLCQGFYKNFGSHLYFKHPELYYESKMEKEFPNKQSTTGKSSILSKLDKGLPIAGTMKQSKQAAASSFNSMSSFKFKCNSCPRKFKTDYLLKLHSKSHKMKSILEARYKPKKQGDARNEAVDDDNNQPFKCRSCEKTFKSWRAVCAHERFHHGTKATMPKPHIGANSKDKKEDDLLICGLCNKVFPDQASMRDHMRWHKGQTDKNKQPAEATKKGTKIGNDNGGKSTTVKMSCNICAVFFDSRELLMEHMMGHTTISTEKTKEQSSSLRKFRSGKDQSNQEVTPVRKAPVTKDNEKTPGTVKNPGTVKTHGTRQEKNSRDSPNLVATDANKRSLIKKRKLEVDKSTKSDNMPQKKKKIDDSNKSLKKDVAIKKKVKVEAEVPKKVNPIKKKLNIGTSIGKKKGKLAAGLFSKKFGVAKKSVVSAGKKATAFDIKCVRCSKTFTNSFYKHVHTINVHKKVPNSVKDRYCKECNILYNSHEKLIAHGKKVHKPLVKKPLKVKGAKVPNVDQAIVSCSQCNAKFNTLRGLKVHRHRVHGVPNSLQQTGIKQQCLMCLECQQLFKSGSEYKDHLKQYHGLEAVKTESNTMEIVDNGVLKTITSTELEIEIKKEVLEEELIGERAPAVDQITDTPTDPQLDLDINILPGDGHPSDQMDQTDSVPLDTVPTDSVSVDTGLTLDTGPIDINVNQDVLDTPAPETISNQPDVLVDAVDTNKADEIDRPYPVSCVVVDVDTSLIKSPQLFSIPVIKLDRLKHMKTHIQLADVAESFDGFGEDDTASNDVTNEDGESQSEVPELSADNSSIVSITEQCTEANMDDSTNETGLVITSTVSEADTFTGSSVVNTEATSNEGESEVAVVNEPEQGESMEVVEIVNEAALQGDINDNTDQSLNTTGDMEEITINKGDVNEKQAQLVYLGIDIDNRHSEGSTSQDISMNELESQMANVSGEIDKQPSTEGDKDIDDDNTSAVKDDQKVIENGTEQITTNDTEVFTNSTSNSETNVDSAPIEGNAEGVVDTETNVDNTNKDDNNEENIVGTDELHVEAEDHGEMKDDTHQEIDKTEIHAGTVLKDQETIGDNTGGEDNVESFAGDNNVNAETSQQPDEFEETDINFDTSQKDHDIIKENFDVDGNIESFVRDNNESVKISQQQVETEETEIDSNTITKDLETIRDNVGDDDSVENFVDDDNENVLTSQEHIEETGINQKDYETLSGNADVDDHVESLGDGDNENVQTSQQEKDSEMIPTNGYVVTSETNPMENETHSEGFVDDAKNENVNDSNGELDSYVDNQNLADDVEQVDEVDVSCREKETLATSSDIEGESVQVINNTGAQIDQVETMIDINSDEQNAVDEVRANTQNTDIENDVDDSSAENNIDYVVANTEVVDNNVETFTENVDAEMDRNSGMTDSAEQTTSCEIDGLAPQMSNTKPDANNDINTQIDNTNNGHESMEVDS